MTEEKKEPMGTPQKTGKQGGGNLTEDSFFEDEQLPSKSRLPIFIGIGVVVVLIVIVAFYMLKPKLNEADRKIFDEAAEALRTDDYNNYPPAEQKLLKLAEKYPSEPLVISWLAQLYLAWGDTLWTETLFIDDKREEANEKRLEIKKELDTVNPKATQKKAELENAMNQVVEKFKELDSMYIKRFKEADAKKSAGQEWAKKGIAAASADYRSYRAIADYYRIQRSYEDSEKMLKYVGEANPESAGLRFIKGAIMIERDKKYDEALKLFEEALKIDPKFTKAQYFIGLTLDRKGDKTGAEEAMKKVLQTSPNHPGARTYLQMITILDLVKQSLERAAQAPAEDGQAAQQPAPADKKNEPAQKKAEQPPKDKKPAKKKK